MIITNYVTTTSIYCMIAEIHSLRIGHNLGRFLIAYADSLDQEIAECQQAIQRVLFEHKTFLLAVDAR